LEEIYKREVYNFCVFPCNNKLTRNLTSVDYIESILSLVNDELTNNTYEYYGAEFYQPDDHGTSHTSVIDAEGNGVAVTSTVNLQ